MKIIGIIILFVAALFLSFSCSAGLGIGGFGPINRVTVVVNSKHVDRSSESSHYMVTTDKGTFEVDNGLILGVWNADELFGKLQEGKSYDITTKGNKQVGMFLQSYPYIIAVSPK